MSTKTGKMLKQLRREKDLTLQSVADGVGCSPSYLHRLENNSRKNPSIQMAIKLADFYGINVSLLDSDNQEDIDNLVDKVIEKQVIIDELHNAIEEMKKGLCVLAQYPDQSRVSFVEVQKSLLYVQSII